jgi:hypothetical protein
MGYTVDYLADEEIVKIAITGRLNFTTAQEYSKEARKLAREYECKKYLIDHSETILPDGIKQIYTDGDVLKQFGFQNTDKIAILVDCKKDDELLQEKAAENVKWSKSKYFNNRNKAIIWLNENK